MPEPGNSRPNRGSEISPSPSYRTASIGAGEFPSQAFSVRWNLFRNLARLKQRATGGSVGIQADALSTPQRARSAHGSTGQWSISRPRLIARATVSRSARGLTTPEKMPTLSSARHSAGTLSELVTRCHCGVRVLMAYRSEPVGQQRGSFGRGIVVVILTRPFENLALRGSVP